MIRASWSFLTKPRVFLPEGWGKPLGSVEYDFSIIRLKRLARFLLLFAVFIGAASTPFIVAARGIKPLGLPTDPEVPQNTTLYDVQGRPFAVLHGDENRIFIDRKDMPRSIRLAVVAAEDRRFFSHAGVSLGAIARAFTTDVGAGDVMQGGSTITQQYARNAFDQIGTARTVDRKLKEALLAVRLENEYSKEEILDRYLNTIYFGRGAYGIEAAALAYFNKHARTLSLSESAYLAGIIRAPEVYAGDPHLALTRRNQVLGAMEQLGNITPKWLARARRAPSGVVAQRDPPVRAAYFVEYVRRLLHEPASQGGFGLSDSEIMGGGLKVYTTLDLDMQEAAEQAVRRVLDRHDDPEVGFVATTTNGEVRAMIGGRNFTSISRAHGFNFATQEAPGGGRAVGSTFKPFTLTAFLQAGYSVNSRFEGPSHITIDDKRCDGPNGPWRPSNYDHHGYGNITVAKATEDSVNTVFAQVVTKAGPANVVRAARLAGITSPLQPVCSVTLGPFGVTPLEMARAYSTFAGQGLRPDVLTVTKIVAPDGKMIATREVNRTRTIDPHIADEVNGVLQKVVTDGTGKPAEIDRPSAGKTGTTEEHRDVWYVGYTPDPGLTAAVWIGYPPDKNGYVKAMQTLHGVPATGGGFAGRIWKYFMEQSTKEMPKLDFADVKFDGKVIGGGSYFNPDPTPSPSRTCRKPRCFRLRP
jgi:membrane peptidoglycan carboxypeptidase